MATPLRPPSRWPWITLFVLALMIYVMVKFNARANPVPSRTTHNTTVEVLWTVIPILILVGWLFVR